MPKRIFGVSKRHFKRLVRSQIRYYSRGNVPASDIISEANDNVASANVASDTTEAVNLNTVFDETVEEVTEENQSYQETDNPKTLTDKLASWAISHKIPRNACDALLKILVEERLDVPSCAKTLLQTKVHQLDLSEMPPGQYFHIGFKKAIELLNLKIADSVNELPVDIFVDGLPIYKSSSQTLWPILGCISEDRQTPPFLIGTYIGPSKPQDVRSYLNKFVDEFLQIQNEGLIINGRCIHAKIRLFTCDTPARAYLTGTVGHTASHGCSKCQQEGKRINNRLSYSIVPGIPRSDEDFKNRQDKYFHFTTFHSNIHPLERLNVKMISQFPLDVMHLIDLGVMKKILLYILNGKHNKIKLSSRQKLQLNEKIISLAKYTPNEFSRKPRTFNEIHRWKATEFRQLALYTGIVVFKDIIDDDIYYNFLMLHTAYRLISCPANCQKNLDCVQQLFETFIKDFTEIYGKDKVSFNVHNLLHLADCVRMYGNVDSFSSYKFENYLQLIKKDCRKPSLIAQQLHNRILERSIVNKKQETKYFPRGLVNKKNMYSKYQFDAFLISRTNPNNYCYTNDLTAIKIKGFLTEEGVEYVVGNAFTDLTSFSKHRWIQERLWGLVKLKR